MHGNRPARPGSLPSAQTVMIQRCAALACALAGEARFVLEILRETKKDF